MFKLFGMSIEIGSKTLVPIGLVYNNLFGNLIPRDTSIKLGIRMDDIKLV